MDNHPLILTINPGSTSTKVAVFKESDTVFLKNIKHSVIELEKFKKITDQFSYRKTLIYKELEEAGIELSQIRVVVGRGGLLKPIPSGVYRVNEAMKKDLQNSPMGEHASNLGGLIADDIAQQLPDAKAYIADPVVVDEFDHLARYSGHPLFPRYSIFHALNQKAIGRRHAKTVSTKYEEMNLIIVHLGGGISVGAHRKGRVIDVNQALDGDGPFSPERSGTLPMGTVLKAAFSGDYTYEQMKAMLVGKGGMCAYTGSNDAYEVIVAAQGGDKKSYEVIEAMAYQVSKEIGAMSTVLKGDVDAILLTGGIAYNQIFCDFITERVNSIAPIFIYPGEDEMVALAENGALVLSGEVVAKEYK